METMTQDRLAKEFTLPNIQHEDIDISTIHIGERFRKDLGDIAALADSIKGQGLLQPVGVDRDNNLVFGERRIRAFQSLGWLRIPIRRVNVTSIVEGEYAENEVREDFRPSERVAIAAAVAAEMGNRKGQRTDLAANADKLGKTVDVAARKAGFGSAETYERAASVINNGTPELVAAMDSGKVSISAAAIISQEDVEAQKLIVAEGNMKRAAAELRKAKETLKSAEGMPKARSLTVDEKEERQEIFGTSEDRAIDARINDILEAIDAQPSPAEAAKRIPPTLAYAIDASKIRSAAKWLTDFCDEWDAREIPEFLKRETA